MVKNTLIQFPKWAEQTVYSAHRFFEKFGGVVWIDRNSSDFNLGLTLYNLSQIVFQFISMFQSVQLISRF